MSLRVYMESDFDQQADFREALVTVFIRLTLVTIFANF